MERSAESKQGVGRRRWVVISLLATLVGLLNFSIVKTSWLAEREANSAKYPFVWEMTGAYAVLLLLPALLAFMGRFPIARRNLWRRLPLHLLAMTAFGVAHTLLMWGSRSAIYTLLGWGRYDYGDMRYRFLMEGQKQFLIYWAVYAVVSAAAYHRRNRERELAAAHLERQVTEARLAALKMQLNPHFLFNTLNMISSHVYDDPRTAEAMIGHLSDFLRMTLRHSDAQKVPLEKEVEFLGAYLAIMKARFEERLSVELDAPPETLPALVPHLILQPLVENAVTHCMNDHQKQGRIRVAASRERDRLRLCVEDNGPGYSGNVGEALTRGVGLSNTVERLRHLYGADQRFRMLNVEPGGLRLELDFPFEHSPAVEAPP